jgi:hypothetical protein
LKEDVKSDMKTRLKEDMKTSLRREERSDMKMRPQKQTYVSLSQRDRNQTFKEEGRHLVCKLCLPNSRHHIRILCTFQHVYRRASC